MHIMFNHCTKKYEMILKVIKQLVVHAIDPLGSDQQEIFSRVEMLVAKGQFKVAYVEMWTNRS